MTDAKITSSLDEVVAFFLRHEAAHNGDHIGYVRSGLGDAASICDAIANDIRKEHRGRGGKGPTTKLGEQLAAIAKRCGDEIAAFRDKVSDAALREGEKAGEP